MGFTTIFLRKKMPNIKSMQKIIDLIDVPLMFVLSILLTEIKDILGSVAMIITIFYTVWKWRKELMEVAKTKKSVK